jgi:hypothetical protein
MIHTIEKERVNALLVSPLKPESDGLSLSGHRRRASRQTAGKRVGCPDRSYCAKHRAAWASKAWSSDAAERAHTLRQLDHGRWANFKAVHSLADRGSASDRIH